MTPNVSTEPMQSLSNPAKALLDQAYDPQRFREWGHQCVDRLSDYLQQLVDRPESMPVLPWQDPPDLYEQWPLSMADPSQSLDERWQTLQPLLDSMMAQSHHLHHPRYIGHQVSAPLPVAALCEMIATLLNNGSAIYDMGPVSTVLERRLTEWMASLLGWPTGSPNGASGFFTSGGTVGNMTALLAARHSKAPFDAWNDGDFHSTSTPMAVLVSEQNHYSVARALKIMGLGQSGIIPVDTDPAFRIRPDALQRAYDNAQRQGKTVIAVVANACSTATGAYDPMDAIADFCQQHELWMHVDGAHGAAVATSAKYRHLLKGIERADSVVWDAHKMMMMPALMTAVLFRDPKTSYASFAQKASYLFDSAQPIDDQWFNLAHRTMECTKRYMSLKLWVALALFGPAVFEAFIDTTHDLTREWATMLNDSPDFDCAHEPQSNILCFRYTPESWQSLPQDEKNQRHSAIRNRIVESGAFYLVQTELNGIQYLRTTLMNGATTRDDLAALMTLIRKTAAD